jgi:hypothetical protein
MSLLFLDLSVATELRFSCLISFLGYEPSALKDSQVLPLNKMKDIKPIVLSHAVPIDAKRIVVLTDDNFDSWQISIIKNMVLKNLEDLVLGGIPPVGVTDTMEQQKRVATTLIRMSLNRDNYSRFVNQKELCVFNLKKLYDEIIDYHVLRSSKNAATIWDKLIALTWIEGDLERSITKFCNDFDRVRSLVVLHQVSSSGF